MLRAPTLRAARTLCPTPLLTRLYHAKVIDHYERPRNVGSLPKTDVDVGTGLYPSIPKSSTTITTLSFPFYILVLFRFVAVWLTQCWNSVGAPACGDVMKLQIRVDENGRISDVKFKTFGCGSAIASSSYMTERVKGLTLDEAAAIKNTEVAKELCLPPVKRTHQRPSMFTPTYFRRDLLTCTG